MWLQSCCPPVGRLLQSLADRLSATQHKRHGRDGDSDPDDEAEAASFFIPSKKVYNNGSRRLFSGPSSVSLDERHWPPQRPLQDDCKSLRRGSAVSTSSGLSCWLREDSIGELEPSLYDDPAESDPDVPEVDELGYESEGSGARKTDGKGVNKKGRSKQEDVEHYGKLIFRTKISNDEQKFTVYLERACDLPVKGVRTQYDTFVRACLLPGARNAKCSSTLKDTLNPHFHEELSLDLPKKRPTGERALSSNGKGGPSTYLRLSLFDYARQGDHDALGHVLVSLSLLERTEGKLHCCLLKPASLVPGSRGELLLSLCYAPLVHRLTVVVMRARLGNHGNTTGRSRVPVLVDKTEQTETYAKVTLMCGGQKVKRVRTGPVLSCGSAVYNQAFHFVLPVSFLDEASVVVTLLERSRLSRDVVLGRVVSGPYVHHSGGERLTHWGLMLQRRRTVLLWRNVYL